MIDLSSPVPLWQQVVDLIRTNVATGQWPPGQRIPSEREFCEAHGISRTTVRQALAEAESVGLLERIHGKGTFVARPKVQQPLVQLTSFEQTLQDLGLEPQVRLLSSHLRPADAATAHLFGVTTGAELADFRLLGLGSGEPMSLYDSLVPMSLGAGLRPEVERLGAAGELFFINRLLMERYGYPHLQAEQTYEAVIVEPDLAGLLHVPKRSPAFQVTTLFRDPAGHPVELRRAVYRGDKYQFHVTRQYNPTPRRASH